MALSLLGLLLIWWNGQPLPALLGARLRLGLYVADCGRPCHGLQFTSQKALSVSFSGTEILLPTFAMATLITRAVCLVFRWFQPMRTMRGPGYCYSFLA
jgi:hypothetical protein